MGVLKSEKVQMTLSAVLMAAVVLLFYGLPPMLAQAFKNHEPTVEKSAQQAGARDKLSDAVLGDLVVIYAPRSGAHYRVFVASERNGDYVVRDIIGRVSKVSGVDPNLALIKNNPKSDEFAEAASRFLKQ